jgi:hypothetical protein
MEERIIKIVPKEEQDSAVSITRATVKPAIPGTIPVRNSTGKKRTADEAFGPELDSWSKSVSHSNADTGNKPTSLMIQEAEESKLLSEGAEALPSKEIQEHLSEIFFENLYGQTYHLLYKPSFMRKLKLVSPSPIVLVVTDSDVQGRHRTTSLDTCGLRYICAILNTPKAQYHACILAWRGLGIRGSRHCHEAIRVAQYYNTHMSTHTWSARIWNVSRW